jgi:hypothetical protein
MAKVFKVSLIFIFVILKSLKILVSKKIISLLVPELGFNNDSYKEDKNNV